MKYLVTGSFLILSAFFNFACDTNTANTSRNTSNTANANRAVVVNNNSMGNNSNMSMGNNSNMSMGNNSNMSMGNNSNSVATVQDNFWTNAAQSGIAQVELSKLALTKSQNAEVKKFAQMMVTDHSKVNKELTGLAVTKKVMIPTDIESKHKSMKDDLSKLSGVDFDKKYVDTMVSGHEDAVKLFEDQANNSDAELKSFAAKTLPKLKTHFEMIKKIQETVKVK